MRRNRVLLVEGSKDAELLSALVQPAAAIQTLARSSEREAGRWLSAMGLFVDLACTVLGTYLSGSDVEESESLFL